MEAPTTVLNNLIEYISKEKIYLITNKKNKYLENIKNLKIILSSQKKKFHL